VPSEVFASSSASFWAFNKPIPDAATDAKFSTGGVNKNFTAQCVNDDNAIFYQSMTNGVQ